MTIHYLRCKYYTDIYLIILESCNQNYLSIIHTLIYLHAHMCIYMDKYMLYVQRFLPSQ